MKNITLEKIVNCLKNPAERWRELIEAARFLDYEIFPNVPTDNWNEKNVRETFALIIDSLRSVYFPSLPDSFGAIYPASMDLMKSTPPLTEAELSEWNDKRAKAIQTTVDRVLEKRHAFGKCMNCEKVPVYECIWADGRGHAWFCENHFKEWRNEDEREIVSVKEVKDGRASKNWKDNRNPNILRALENEIEESIKPAFGASGGKQSLSRTIVSYFPEHKTYIEPFAGGAAVFFRKMPSEKEILSDLNESVVKAFEILKGLTDEDIQSINEMDWSSTPERFEEVSKRFTEEDVPASDWIFSYIYLKRTSLFNSIGKNYRRDTEGRSLRVPKLESIRDRLKNVEVLSSDFRAVVEKHDSPETLFYFDPTISDNWLDESKITIENLIEFLQGIKGKFVLSWRAKDRKYFKGVEGFKTKIVQDKLRVHLKTKEPIIPLELLVFNYEPKKNENFLIESDKGESLTDDIIVERLNAVQNMGAIVIKPDYVSLSGRPFYVQDGDLDNLEVVCKTERLGVGESAKLRQIINKIFPESEARFVSDPDGSVFRNVPVFDLALIPKSETSFKEVDFFKVKESIKSGFLYDREKGNNKNKKSVTTESDKLTYPLFLERDGKKYVVKETRGGGLVMNKVEEKK